MQEGHRLATGLLGIEVESAWDASRRAVVGAFESAGDARAQVIALGLVLCGYEDQLGVHSWRRPDGAARRYFTALAGWGYELSDVEEVVIGEEQSVEPTSEEESAGDGGGEG